MILLILVPFQPKIINVTATNNHETLQVERDIDVKSHIVEEEKPIIQDNDDRSLPVK